MYSTTCSALENHLKILKILFVFVSKAPYTIEKPRPTPNLWRVRSLGPATDCTLALQLKKTQRVRVIIMEAVMPELIV